MKVFNPVLKMKKKIGSLLSKNLCSLEEQLFSLKVKIDLPPKPKDLQDGFSILTFGFIYLLNKNYKGDQSYEQIDLLNCKEILYDEKEKIKIINIKTTQDQCYSIQAKDNKLKLFYNYIFQLINILNNENCPQNQKPLLSSQFQVDSFPILYKIYVRSLYLIHSDIKNGKVGNDKIEGAIYFKNEKKDNKKDAKKDGKKDFKKDDKVDEKKYDKEILRINSDFLPDKFAIYYAKAISAEPGIKKILFDKYKLSNSNFLESIINNCPNVQEIEFNGYESEHQDFHLEHVPNVINQKFTFNNSQSAFFIDFLNYMPKVKCGITKVCLSSMLMQKSDLINSFDKMSKIKAFESLTSFTFSSIKFDEFPFDTFIEFLTCHEKLEFLSMSDIKVDGSILFSAICESELSIYELHLNNIQFSKPMKLDKKILPYNLMLVDFSHSEFINDSLNPILKLLVSDCIRKNFLNLNLSYLRPITNSWTKTIRFLDMKQCHSNIIDLDYSGNNISSYWFDFISTQKGLQFLSVMDIRIQNPGNFFEFFYNMISKMPNLIGFDIGSANFDKDTTSNFIQKCKNLQNIQHFYFKSPNVQNEVAETFSNIVGSLPQLREVSIDIPGLNPDTYIKLAKSIIQNKSILAANLPFYDESIQQKEIQEVLKLIHNLKVPSTMEQRASSMIAIQKKKQPNDVFDLATTIEMKCSNHQIFEEVIDDSNDAHDELEIEEEEEVLSDDDE